VPYSVCYGSDSRRVIIMVQSPHVRPEFSSCFVYISRSAQPSGGRAYAVCRLRRSRCGIRHGRYRGYRSGRPKQPSPWLRPVSNGNTLIVGGNRPPTTQDRRPPSSVTTSGPELVFAHVNIRSRPTSSTICLTFVATSPSTCCSSAKRGTTRIPSASVACVQTDFKWWNDLVHVCVTTCLLTTAASQ